MPIYRTNGELLRFAIAMALMKVRIRATKSTRVHLAEEDRYAVADDAVSRMRGYGGTAYRWLDEPAPEPKVGETGPSTYKPSDAD